MNDKFVNDVLCSQRMFIVIVNNIDALCIMLFDSGFPSRLNKLRWFSKVSFFNAAKHCPCIWKCDRKSDDQKKTENGVFEQEGPSTRKNVVQSMFDWIREIT